MTLVPHKNCGEDHVAVRFLSAIILPIAIIACASPVPQTPISITPFRPGTNTPTSTATPTARATLTPTVSPTPTAYVTAPAYGQVAIVPILMYHHLSDLPSDSSELFKTWTVSPRNLALQMEWLAQRGFHTITLAQLIGHLKQRQPLPSKPIIISFDDGWEEQYAVAFPILKKHNFVATFFVYTNPIDHAQYLTWAQLQEMSAAGMEIQAHTLSHPHLRTLAQGLAQKEITDSKTILEKRLGKPVVAFAYPFGEYNAAVTEMVKRAGLESAVTLAPGYRQRADELYALPRIRVSYNDTLDDFARHLPP